MKMKALWWLFVTAPELRPRRLDDQIFETAMLGLQMYNSLYNNIICINNSTTRPFNSAVQSAFA